MTAQPASQSKIRRFARVAIKTAGLPDGGYVPLDRVAEALRLERSSGLMDLDDDAPPGLRDVIRRLKGKVLGLLAIEERRFFIDASMPQVRQRFTTAHEIGHDVLPWHKSAYWAEDKSTLDPETRALLEVEANLFAAELIFGAGRYERQANDWAPGLGVPLSLADQFGSSAHASLRYYVENSAHPVALVAFSRRSTAGLGAEVIPEQTFSSARFQERYGPLTQIIGSHVTAAKYPEFITLMNLSHGSVAEATNKLETSRGLVKFTMEGFSNGRLNFVLLFKQARTSGQRLVLRPKGALELDLR